MHPVFATQSRRKKKTGLPWNGDWASHRFKKFVRELGMPENYKLHSLRHSFSTYLTSRGVNLEVVQRLLGHASPQVTARFYDHAMPLHFREEANMVDFDV